MDKVDRLIEIVRYLKEEGGAMGAGGGAPTNSLSASSPGQIAGTAEAGDDPPVDLRLGRRRNWNPFFKNLARVLRRNKKKRKK